MSRENGSDPGLEFLLGFRFAEFRVEVDEHEFVWSLCFEVSESLVWMVCELCQFMSQFACWCICVLNILENNEACQILNDG